MQASWVVPQASQMAPTDFSVLIGAAINWQNQDIYYTGQRIKYEGYSEVDVRNAKKREADDFDKQFTEKTVILPCNSLSTRKDFERRNSLVDSTKDISGVHTPVLILNE